MKSKVTFLLNVTKPKGLTLQQQQKAFVLHLHWKKLGPVHNQNCSFVEVVPSYKIKLNDFPLLPVCCLSCTHLVLIEDKHNLNKIFSILQEKTQMITFCRSAGWPQT